MHNAYHGKGECVGRLVEDPRVKANIDSQPPCRLYAEGRSHYVALTALHYACIRDLGAWDRPADEDVRVMLLLLGAGANPTVITKHSLYVNRPATALDILRRYCRDGHPGIAILEHAMAEPERNALVVKLRRIVITHIGDALPT